MKKLALKIVLGMVAIGALLALSYSAMNQKNGSEYPDEKAFVIVIPSYNNKEWYKLNLDSVLSQDYHNYRVIYIDDVSPDGTGKLVQEYLKEKDKTHLVTLIQNEKRSLALANIYKAIWTCDPQEIIVTVDGDDWLANDRVLSYLNTVYSDPDVWTTYGQFTYYPQGTLGCAKQIPQDVIRRNGVRQYPGGPTHLRTFYAGLFQKIQKEDFLHNGDFYPMAWDVAFLLPIIEMAGVHSRFIPDVLYVYNTSTMMHDHVVNSGLQSELDALIRKKNKYLPLDTLFALDKATEEKRVVQRQVDTTVFSFDRPAQLYAYLESAEKYLTGIHKTHVIYRATNDAYEAGYREVIQKFPKIIFHKQSQNPHGDFKEFVLSSLFSHESLAEYMMFVVDDIIVTDYVDLQVCTKALSEYLAWGFFLRLGKNINYCYMLDKPTPCPQGEDIGNDMFTWDFSAGDGDWAYPNCTDMTIYRKKDVMPFLKNEPYVTPNTLEFRWWQCRDMGGKGLSFQTSKMINIPINVVNPTSGRRNSSYTPQELLEKFQQGLKIDIAPFYQVRNVSPHVDYTVTFVPKQ